MPAHRDKELSTESYWNQHYTGPEKDHEWFRSYNDLVPFFNDHFFNQEGLQAKDNPRVLHLGSGRSEIPEQLASAGYGQQLCIDFSEEAYNQMSKKHENIKGIEWKKSDVRYMEGIPDKSIDVAFDKGTFDALIYGDPWKPEEQVKDDTSRYMKQLHRVLKDDGVFLYVTFRQRHFVEKLLNPEDLALWDLQMTALVGNDGSFGYFGWIIRKKGARPRAVIEASS
ncbi:S-adenosyl-L-methionine-dependent methyltransferase [Trichoderma novae-zelandiae]